MARLSEIQDKIADGDLFFICGRAWYSWLIRWNTFSKFTHVGIVVWCTIGDRRRLCICEATSGHGVRICPMDRYLAEREKRGEKVFWFKTSISINRNAVVQYGNLHWGKHYASVWQLIYSFGWLTSLVRKFLGLPIKDINGNRFFCSELVAGALVFAGLHLEEPVKYSPAELSESAWLMNRGELTLQ